MRWYFIVLLCCHAYGQRAVYLQRTEKSKLSVNERKSSIERAVVLLISDFEHLTSNSTKRLLGLWVVWRISDMTVSQVSREEKARNVCIFYHYDREIDWFLYDKKQKINTFNMTMSTSDIRYRPVSRDLYWMGEETSYRVWNVGNLDKLVSKPHNMQLPGSVRRIRFAGPITIVLASRGIYKISGISKPKQITPLPYNAGQHLYLETSSEPMQIWWSQKNKIEHEWSFWKVNINGGHKFKRTTQGFDVLHSFTVCRLNSQKYILLCGNDRLKKLGLSPDRDLEEVLPTRVKCEDVAVEGDNIYVFVRPTMTLETYDLNSGKLVHCLSTNRTPVTGEISFQVRLTQSNAGKEIGILGRETYCNKHISFPTARYFVTRAVQYYR